MRNPSAGYVTPSLLCGEPGCAGARTFTDNFFGLAADVGPLLAAMCREE